MKQDWANLKVGLYWIHSLALIWPLINRFLFSTWVDSAMSLRVKIHAVLVRYPKAKTRRRNAHMVYMLSSFQARRLRHQESTTSEVGFIEFCRRLSTRRLNEPRTWTWRTDGTMNRPPQINWDGNHLIFQLRMTRLISCRYWCFKWGNRRICIMQISHNHIQIDRTRGKII